MDRSQRIVLVLYCLLTVFCCVWVPWHIIPQDEPPVRAGYGWLWSGPSSPTPAISEDAGPRTSPDFPIIALELFAATVLAGAVWAATRR